MTDSEDYEYSGHRSKLPPVLLLLGYFGFGIGWIWLSFDRLAEFTHFENPPAMARLRPMMQVHWLEKIGYDLGGKYVVFGLSIAFSLVLIGAGISRLRSWLHLRNGR